MRVSLLLLLVLAASIKLAKAQNNSTTALTSALQAFGLTTLLTLVGAIPNATSIMNEIASGPPRTVFAPNNEAFAKVADQQALTNTSFLSDVVSYHVLVGAFGNATGSNAVPPFPNHTLARTLLTDPEFTTLKRGQIIVLSDVNNTVSVVGNVANITSVNSTTVGNVTIYVVPDVIPIPVSAIDTIRELGETSIVGAIDGLGANGTVLSSAIQTAPAMTFFVPNNTAVQEIQANLTSLSVEQISNVLSNHIVNGTALYSPFLVNGLNFTSASGEPLRIIKNETGTYVKTENVVALITRADIPVSNGVLHLISRVLFDTNLNVTAAQAAVSSVSVFAATQTATETGPIAPSPTSTTGAHPSPSHHGSAMRNVPFLGTLAGLGGFAVLAVAVL